MKYAIVQVSNGNYSVVSETTNINTAKVNFHSTAAALWNAPDVETASLRIMDENLDTVGDYKEFISHVEPEPAPGPEPTPGEGE